MAETNFSRVLKKKLADVIDDRARSLARGDALSFDEYRLQVGFIDGMNAAINLCNELDKEYS